MGKKSRRKREATLNFLRQNAAETVDVVETVERWPRVRPHWKRFRRRLCDYCPACAHLAEPRFLVCSGCGRKRYCSEKCQREDWPAHQKDCLKWQKLIIQQDLADVEQNLAELDAREKDTER